MTLRVEPLTGPALTNALPALARLRLTVFREWPYLYDGTLDDERGYLERFATSPESLIVAAREGATIVGIATASPMAGHTEKFAGLFRAHGLDPDRIFYFGESVLLKAYRGQGIGHAFFDHREAHARAQVGITHTAFCGVIRPADHPMRPKSYVPLDAFWGRRGYRHIEGLVGSFNWTDIGETAESDKPMQFWMRAL